MLASRGERIPVWKRGCRDDAFGEERSSMAGLVAKCRWGGTRDLVLTFTKTCGAAENKGGQHAHLAPEGGAGLLIKLGLQVATACSG